VSSNNNRVNRYKAHQNLVKETKFALQRKYTGKIRTFDRHVGKFLPLVFIKKVLSRQESISNWSKYIVAINKKGMADVYGYISLHNILIHLEFEMKTGRAVQTKEQKDWQKHIESMGGFYCLVRDADKAIEELENYLRTRKLI